MMLDPTTRILLKKYQPDCPYLKEAEPVVKVLIAMEAHEHTESSIAKACNDFNATYPEYMSYSYVLPCDYHGIAAGSWIIIDRNGGGSE